MQKAYVIKWFRDNFGSRFCSTVGYVPGLTHAFFMFCDHDRSDPLRHKEDRFTILASPLFFIFIAIPYGWKGIKLFWKVLIWSCSWNVYVEEEDEDNK